MIAVTESGARYWLTPLVADKLLTTDGVSDPVQLIIIRPAADGNATTDGTKVYQKVWFTAPIQVGDELHYVTPNGDIGWSTKVVTIQGANI